MKILRLSVQWIVWYVIGPVEFFYAMYTICWVFLLVVLHVVIMPLQTLFMGIFIIIISVVLVVDKKKKL